MVLQKLQSDAGAVMEQRRARLDLELVLEASLNAEDIERAQEDSAATVAERDRRFMKLFADYQLQKTHLARALTDTRAADRMRQDAERDAERLRSDIAKLQVRLRSAARTLREISAGNTIAAVYCHVLGALSTAGLSLWPVTQLPPRGRSAWIRMPDPSRCSPSREIRSPGGQGWPAHRCLPRGPQPRWLCCSSVLLAVRPDDS